MFFFSGASNLKDWFNILLQGVIQLGVAPQCSSDLFVELVPVDLIVNDISILSQKFKYLAVSMSSNFNPNQDAPPFYGLNYMNPEFGTISFRKIFQVLSDYLEESGKKLICIPLEEWATMLQNIPENNALYTLRSTIGPKLASSTKKDCPINWTDLSTDMSAVTSQILVNYFKFLQLSLFKKSLQ